MKIGSPLPVSLLSSVPLLNLSSGLTRQKTSFFFFDTETCQLEM